LWQVQKTRKDGQMVIISASVENLKVERAVLTANEFRKPRARCIQETNESDPRLGYRSNDPMHFIAVTNGVQVH
jgi:hypothetical protein